MQYTAADVDHYIDQIPNERKQVFSKLRSTIKKNLPKGFEECINYKMPAYIVPHSIYAGGYHCDPKLPLPFVSIASQKNFIALYHMGMYAQPELCDWFVSEYPKHCKYKLDMGKSCVRFKKIDDIPFELISELIQKMSVEDWISVYEKNVKTK